MMMRIWAILGIFVMGVISLHPAKASYMTGADLLKTCRVNDLESRHLCENYIAGLIDYHYLIRSLGTAPSVEFCIPRNTPIAEVTQNVLRYLARYPEHDHFVASPAVALALHKAYPCKSR